jgi:hypothetical protein
MKTFALQRAKPRRRMAPAPALTKINSADEKCSTPKITASAAAPAAAASAKSHIGAGGRCADCLHCGIRRQPAGLDIFDRMHGGGHAIHVYTGRIGRHFGN